MQRVHGIGGQSFDMIYEPCINPVHRFRRDAEEGGEHKITQTMSQCY